MRRSAQVSSGRMGAVEDGVHLVVRMGAVQASQGISSLNRVAYALGTVPSMPALVKAVAQHSGASQALLVAKHTPSFCRMRQRGSRPARWKCRVAPDVIPGLEIGAHMLLLMEW